MKSIYVLALILGFASASTEAAEGEGCLGTLVKNITTVSDNSASSYALVSRVNSSLNTSEQNSVGAKFLIPDIGPVGLTSSQAQAVSRNFFSSTNLNWDQERMINVVSETLSGAAVELYRICVDGSRKDGVFVKAYDANDESVQIEVRWVAGVRAPTNAIVSFTVDGADLSGATSYTH